MPHVLWELQGLQRLVESHDSSHGETGSRFKMAVAGEMDTQGYQQVARDLVSFLVYVGEPAKLVRYKVGFWTIAFLLVLLLATYMMKREYWKDIH